MQESGLTEDSLGYNPWFKRSHVFGMTSHMYNNQMVTKAMI